MRTFTNVSLTFARSTLLAASLVASHLFAQYQAEKVTTAPTWVKPEVCAQLQKQGVTFKNTKGAILEVWLVEKLPFGKATEESDVTLKEVL
jgi:hypothetical protein